MDAFLDLSFLVMRACTFTLLNLTNEFPTPWPEEWKYEGKLDFKRALELILHWSLFHQALSSAIIDSTNALISKLKNETDEMDWEC